MSIMQKILLFLFIFFNVLFFGQTQGQCGFLEAQEYLFKQDPSARQRVADLMALADEQGNLQARTNSVIANYTIPVVFHVLHQGGSENISDAQINDQIAILNRDFTKNNSDTINAVSAFQNLIGNCRVVFKLASIDPNGNCTNGITRHFDSNTDWTVNFANYVYTWDRTKYLNIYVVRSMPAGSAAYTYYPGTAPPNVDAVVVQSIYVGSIGTSQPFVSRIITHEVGHWLNLQHPWGSTNSPGFVCGDDGVSDTPITKGFTFCNLANAINCTPGVTENVQNYMDYAYCQIMFTKGQCTRMINALNSSVASRNNLWSSNNLLATGVTNPVFSCRPKAQFNFNNKTVCIGGNAGFTDFSYNAPITSWQWSSPQASNVSSQQNGILTFTSSGLVSVKLKVANAFGSDSIVQQGLLVLPTSGSGVPNLTQGFENTNLPNSTWLVTVPQTGNGFTITSAASLNGYNSAWVDNYYNKPNTSVSFFTPSFNLQNTSASELSFFYAYAQGSEADNDKLSVYGTDDCGLTWLSLFSKSGATLNSTGIFVPISYQSPSQDQWAEVTINTDYYFGGKPNVYFKFEFTPDLANTGNNLYIDDINLSGQVALGFLPRRSDAADVNVLPNPFHSSLFLQGKDLESVSSYTIKDISGRILFGIENPEIKQNQILITDLSYLLKGIYFIQINTTYGTQVKKLIKE